MDVLSHYGQHLFLFYCGKWGVRDGRARKTSYNIPYSEFSALLLHVDESKSEKNTMESKTGGMIRQVIKGAMPWGKPGLKLL